MQYSVTTESKSPVYNHFSPTFPQVQMTIDADATNRDAKWFRQLRAKLLKWYGQHGRSLPWRAAEDPYIVWISEVMLQQTTVAAVEPYFRRFIDRFPTVNALAQAPIEQVLRLWEGLGYYSRARNLHRTAQIVAAEHAGRFPQSVELLQSLPGIGRYTAGAIASFAFGMRAPIVEANTLRLYSRLLGYDGDPRSSAGTKVLWEFAEAVLPQQGAGIFNQALMDLGATVCRVTNPACEECPLQRCCAARATNRQQEIPRPAVRPEVTPVTEVAVAVISRGRLLLRQRESHERWAGLWDFPRSEIDITRIAATKPLRVDDVIPQPAHQQVTAGFQQQTGLSVSIGPILCTMKYSFTRYRAHLICVRGELASTRLTQSLGCLQWIPLKSLAETPLSITGRRLVDHLQSDT